MLNHILALGYYGLSDMPVAASKVICRCQMEHTGVKRLTLSKILMIVSCCCRYLLERSATIAFSCLFSFETIATSALLAGKTPQPLRTRFSTDV